MGALGAEHMGAHALTPAVPAIAGLMIARRLAELTGGVTERLQHFRDGRVFRPCQSNSGRLRMAETSSRRRLPTP